jgi:MFS transporter, CP family, cyanate transporter
LLPVRAKGWSGGAAVSALDRRRETTMLASQRFGAVALLWLAGVALRMTILALPAVIASIKDELQLSATEVGVLTGLPVALFAFAAVPGALLIARLGALSALLGGLFLTAIASGLRSAVGDIMALYATTMLMGLGVAIMQPALPPLVRLWLPDHVGFGTAVYTNGLLVGEILPVAFTAPMLPLIDGSWRVSLIVWSLPVLAIAVLVAMRAPRIDSKFVGRVRWWPDWRSGLIWRLGLIFGSVTSMYFTSNGFLPIYLSSIGRSDMIGDALTALNLGQMPASLLLLVCADRLVRRVWPYFAAGILALASIFVLVVTAGPGILVASAVLGFCCGGILTLALALPPLLCAPEDVAATSAAVFTLSYGCAVLVPVVSGSAWDLTGMPRFAFLPIAACAVLLMVLAARIEFQREETPSGPCPDAVPGRGNEG